MNKLLQLIFLCLCSNIGIAQLNVQFDPIPGSFNVASANPVYAMDINYDSTDMTRQVFHLFLPDTTGSFPLVIYIHGGGFTGGSPGIVIQTKQADIKYFLDRAIAYASIGYRLLPNPSTTDTDSLGIIKCLNDAKRGLQFIRYHASELNIDMGRVALTGNSAGAGTALWLATRSDMADSSSADPVLGMSTRVCAAAVSGSQSTYDLYRWETDVFHDFDGQGTNYTVDSLVAILTFLRYSNFYGGIDSNYHILHDPALIQYRQEVDMLGNMSSDDPPLWFANGSAAIHPSQDPLHHVFHGREINDYAIAAGISEVKANLPNLGINTTGGESNNAFLERHLNNCLLVSSTNDMTKKEVVPIKIYPNPAQQQLYIDTEIMNPSFEVYNTMGQLVLKGMGQEIQIENLSKGIYVLKIASQCLKFVKE